MLGVHVCGKEVVASVIEVRGKCKGAREGYISYTKEGFRKGGSFD